MKSTLRIAPLDERSLATALLETAGLPTADLAVSPVSLFGAWQDEALVGVIGLEAHGAHGLVRSLAVRADLRHRGIGGRLLDALEAHARATGLDELWLLTETATHFFAARGYRPADRRAAPPGVAATPEFTSLCPASACCMRRALRVRPAG